LSKDIIAIIPARSGSKGVPNKNVIELNGYPLIAYSIKAAQKSKLISRVIVSTDSPEYAEIAQEFGAEIPFLRPKEISSDLSKDFDFFKHALDWFRYEEGCVPEVFVHLRPTTPLRDPEVIDIAIKTFYSKFNSYSALRSVHEMAESAYKCFEIKDNTLLSIFSRDSNLEKSNEARQMFPSTLEANGYVDIIKSDLIRERSIIHGNKVFGFMTERAYEVDVLSDLEMLEFILMKKPNLYKRLFLND
jgi:CMP-N,N'-diacetyllegionaminic acid synthase